MSLLIIFGAPLNRVKEINECVVNSLLLLVVPANYSDYKSLTPVGG